MGTEDEFQAALDADPSNHFLREVFADWLEEQGDARAAGYRMLGRLRIFPLVGGGPQVSPMCSFGDDTNDLYHRRGEEPRLRYGVRSSSPTDGLIPAAWFAQLMDWYEGGSWAYSKPDVAPKWWKIFDSRRKAENAAAKAGLLLSDQQRERIAAHPRYSVANVTLPLV